MAQLFDERNTRRSLPNTAREQQPPRSLQGAGMGAATQRMALDHLERKLLSLQAAIRDPRLQQVGRISHAAILMAM